MHARYWHCLAACCLVPACVAQSHSRGLRQALMTRPCSLSCPPILPQLTRTLSSPVSTVQAVKTTASSLAASSRTLLLGQMLLQSLVGAQVRRFPLLPAICGNPSTTRPATPPPPMLLLWVMRTLTGSQGSRPALVVTQNAVRQSSRSSAPAPRAGYGPSASVAFPTTAPLMIRLRALRRVSTSVLRSVPSEKVRAGRMYGLAGGA